MACLIIYGSRFGSSKLFAESLSSKLNADKVDANDVTDEQVNQYSVIILGICLLEGQLQNARKMREWIEAYPNKKWIIYISGFSNPTMSDYKKILAEYFSKEMIATIPIFYLQCTIGHKRLELMQSVIQRLQTEQNNGITLDRIQLTQDELELMAQYGTTYDRIQENELVPIIIIAQKYLTTT